MEPLRRIRNLLYGVLLIAATLLWIVGLLLFSQVTENSDDFARYTNWIFLINSVGIAVLVTLIAGNLIRLIRDHRRQIPGSRLETRVVSLLVILAITPLVVVYSFSVEFINRGIDEWFNVDVERGLGNALELSQTALDLQTRDSVAALEAMARVLNTQDGRVDIASEIGRLQRESGARELTIFGPNNQIIATSAEDPEAAVPPPPSEEILLQFRQAPVDASRVGGAASRQPSDDIFLTPRPGETYVNFEPTADGRYQIMTAVALSPQLETGELQILRAIFPVQPRFSDLANSVEASYNQIAGLDFQRTALKYSFTLTLSLVLLIALLASVYGAFFFARRLIVPIQQLMQGTRAVARGDLDTRLPSPAHDEIGFLVNSFNDMTRRLAGARQEARTSEQLVESERQKLAVILARLTTGVVSLEPDMRIRTANGAASAILGMDLESHIGESLVELSETRPLLAQFLTVVGAHSARHETEWREQIVLRGDAGRRVLMCACTELPPEENNPGGIVVVFDDITALLQAQRDAAWGEVARRLAHEIKNPLTPIRLSAERMRRRYLESDSKELELLDRSTHTIIQQVEAMKDMVNAFSEYARAPGMELSRIDLNELIGEVTELYRHEENAAAVKITPDRNLPRIEADIGRMRQVFHNLMRNAFEATEHQKDARVDILTRYFAADSRELVEIVVADNGPGFSAEIIDQAFEPYVTSKAKGTGLGLAIVKKLIEEHGGQIRAGNDERGGAHISILIPISGGDGAALMDASNENRRERV
ncbi:ATP-binding protein [Candidatus Rariloculus sp.]|uniref:sensor histidine kinase n=1 Tax=Candidatus Rariloculus sp. TaxID=3101265 RepID=UPI003D0D5730